MDAYQKSREFCLQAGIDVHQNFFKSSITRVRACAQQALRMRSWWQPLTVKEPAQSKNLKIVYSVA